jgi:hypothetical protein
MYAPKQSNPKLKKNKYNEKIELQRYSVHEEQLEATACGPRESSIKLPIGLESSLKLESWRMCPLWEKFRSSSLKVGSPSLNNLWITISIFKATC